MCTSQKYRFSILLFVSFFILTSCSKDGDDPTTPEVTVTVSTANFSTTMDENPTNGQVIGNVQGSTNQGAVTFSVTEQTPAGAFAIDAASGELKVADATLFDFETNPTITGTVNVANGAVSKNASVIITLDDVNEENVFDGNVVLNTQAEVDEFGTHNYIGITGYLIIGYNSGSDYSNITNLSPLQALTFVGREIVISHNGELQTLTGLDNLADIGSSLGIYENPVLITLENLSRITDIHRSLNISSNASLKSFYGLHNITNVEVLTIKNMPVTNLDGLHNIASLGGTLYIQYNPILENIDALSGIRSIQGSITITNNPILADIEPLQNITDIVEALRISDNQSLLNLDGLRNIGVKYSITISNNASLTNLSGLSSVTTLERQMVIEKNISLSSLNGLENLIEVAQQMRAWQNSSLSDFCALTDLCVSGNLASFITESNAYNPTKQDIIDGNCSL